MMVALGGGVALVLAFPQSFDVPFWIWLVVLYLGVLALEMVVLLRTAPGNDTEGSRPVARNANAPAARVE